MTMPQPGDVALFTEHGTAGHTGRVTDIVRGRIRVKMVDGRIRLVDPTNLTGYWPKGSRKRTQDRLVRSQP